MSSMKMALVRKKAEALRTACLDAGISRSPDRERTRFKDLPLDRQAPWLALAHCYLALFYVRHEV